MWLSPFYPSALADSSTTSTTTTTSTRRSARWRTSTRWSRAARGPHQGGRRHRPDPSSDRHEWFRAAFAAGRYRERERYIFRDGKGADGELPPNNWPSIFGGGAWRSGSSSPSSARPVVPAPVREGLGRLQLGPPRGPRGLPEDAAVLERPGRGRVPRRRRTRPEEEPGPGLRRLSKDPRGRGAVRGRPAPAGTATRCRTSTPSGAPSSTSTTRRAPPSPRRGSPRTARRATPRPTASARRSTSTCCARASTPGTSTRSSTAT